MTEGIEAPYDGPALRRWREARRLTKRQAEALFDLAPRSLELVERGKRGVSKQVRRLTRYYDRYGPLDPVPAPTYQATRFLPEPDGEDAARGPASP